MRRPNILNRINFPLIMGLCIILLIAAVSFYPEQFATSDPYAKETLQYEKGSGKILVPPVPPGEEYKWGTDEKGRDLRSLIAYGCRATMFMALGVAFVRLIIALPLAIAAAYKSKAAYGIIKFFNITFNAFPLILIILLLSRIDLFNDLFSNPMSAAAFIMSIFGWSKLAKLLANTAEDVLAQDFIEGEIAIGKTKLDIAIQNVIPHIIPSIVVFFCLEVAVVLLLLAQVGVLGLVLSGGLVDAQYGNLRVPYEFDWASLLVFSHELFNTSKMWLITYPAGAFALSIIGFNLLGEGIRIEFEKRNSRIITSIKRIPGFLSPFRLIYELRDIKLYKKSVYSKLGIIILVLAIALFPKPQSEHSFDSVTAFETVQDIGSSEFKYREYKVGRNVIAFNYLTDKLKQYGIQPFDDKYVHEMLTQDNPEIVGSEITINSKKGDSTKLSYSKDYILAETVEANGSFELVKLDRTIFKDYGSISRLSERYRDNILLIDIRGMEYNELKYITSDIKNLLKPKGIILVEDWSSAEGRGNRTIYVRDMGDIFTILISGDKGEELLKQKDITISVKTDIEIVKQILYANVMGIIPGKDEVLKNDIIIIGSSINSITESMGKGNYQALNTGGLAIELELARMLSQAQEAPDRTVIFAFWDESNRFNKGAKIFSNKYIDRSQNNVFYVDIGGLEDDVLIIDSSGIKPKNKKGQSYVRSLKSNLDNNNIEAVFRSISNSSIDSFSSSKQEILAFDSANPVYVEETKKGQKSAELTREDLIRFHDIGQMIVDTVFDIIYDKRT